MSATKKPKEKTINKTINEESDKVIKPKTKKFNEKEFNKRLENFSAWEKKRKEKIKKLQEEKEEKEIEKFNSKNIHHNKKITKGKINSIVDRLYTKDINKREQNKIILTKVYTPSFTPFIYTKKENIKKNSNKNKKENKNNKSQTQRHFYHKEETDEDKDEDEDESDSDDEKNNYKTYYDKNKFFEDNIKNDDLYEDIYEDIDEKKNGRYKKISNSQRNFKKVEKLNKNGSNKIIKIKKNHNSKVVKFSDNEDEEAERVVIENAFRNRLFKHKK